MRYSRQDSFLKNKLGKFDQKIFENKILVVGCGGIGSVLIEQLVRGGFQNVKIIDNDIIDETNLQRQNYTEVDLGKLKIDGIKKRVCLIDSNLNYEYYSDLITKKNIKFISENSNLIIDTTDNFETRKIINSYCEDNKIDWLYTGAVKSEIVCCLFKGKDKFFSKIFPKDVIDESCCEVGVLASTTFSAASLAYNQILKYFLNEETNELIKLDLWTNKLHVVKLK